MDVEVVYIAGWMRSGTTLLCEMFGAFDGTLAVGELSGIWLALSKDHPCSCGVPLSQCPLWSRVRADIERDHPRLEMIELADAAKQVLRTRNSLQLLRLGDRPRHQWPTVTRLYVEVMEDLYRSLATHSGCSRIVDSSKLPPSFLLQRLMPNVATQVVHITRDPRAVANSELKTLVRSGPNPELTPPGKRPFRSATLWSGANVAVASLAKAAGGAIHVRYEDLTENVDSVLDNLAERIGTTRGPDALSTGHIAVGNPARMGGSSRSVTRDDRWKSELRTRDRAMVSAVTAPARLILSLMYRR